MMAADESLLAKTISPVSFHDTRVMDDNCVPIIRPSPSYPSIPTAATALTSYTDDQASCDRSVCSPTLSLPELHADLLFTS